MNLINAFSTPRLFLELLLPWYARILLACWGFSIYTVTPQLCSTCWIQNIVVVVVVVFLTKLLSMFFFWLSLLFFSSLALTRAYFGVSVLYHITPILQCGKIARDIQIWQQSKNARSTSVSCVICYAFLFWPSWVMSFGRGEVLAYFIHPHDEVELTRVGCPLNDSVAVSRWFLIAWRDMIVVRLSGSITYGLPSCPTDRLLQPASRPAGFLQP